MHIPYFFSQISGVISGQVESSGIIVDAAFEKLGEVLFENYSRKRQSDTSAYVIL